MTPAASALDYTQRGYSVIPIRFTGSVEDRKRPLLDSWEAYQKEPATREQVLQWWAQWPKANVGIVMGAVSGIVAIDLDGPNAVSLLRQAKVDMPRTAAVNTGNGHHAYYRHPGYPVSNRARLLSDGAKSGVDVRGDGGYVVAPPSVHGTGRVYQWVIPLSEGVSELSPSLKALIERKGQVGPVEFPDGSWVDEAMRGVPEGQRDETCAKLAGYWLRHVGPEDCARVLRRFAAGCTPPFTERELQKTIASVYRIESTRKAAEIQEHTRTLPVTEAAPWLSEVESNDPRKGVTVRVPGIVPIGGLVPGDLVVLAGRTRMGKSTYACQLSVEAGIKAKLPTLVVSAEMTRRDWGSWMAAYLSNSTTQSLTRPLREELRSQWLSSPIAIADPGIVTIKQIRELAESRLGLKLLIVDHIGLVGATRKDNRVLEVGEVCRGLKAIAKDLQCTVLALCQLNRRVEGSEDKQPRLDDLRESGEIEHSADSVLFLWTEERDLSKAELPMTLTLAKNRHGPEWSGDVMCDRARRSFRFMREAGDEVPF